MSDVTVRLQPTIRDDGGWRVAAEIDGVSPARARLWYRIPDGPMPDALAIAHAVAVSTINQAMAIGRDLVIDGPLTPGIVTNLAEYQRAWSAWMPDKFRPVAIRPRELVADAPYRPERKFVLPFSGGLDSAFSAWRLARENALGALVAVHGLDIPLADTARWDAVTARLRDCAGSLDVPLVDVATNWNDLALGRPGYLGYFLPTVAAALLLSGHYGGAVSPASYGYDQLVLPLETNPVTDPLLGRPGFPVRHHGAEAHRIDKVAAIADWPQVLQHLRPCEDTRPDGLPCGRCRKCMHTALTFCALGLPVPPAFDGTPPSLAQIEQFPLTPYSILALQEVVVAARRRGATDAWIAAVERRLAGAAARTPADQEAEELRRRLDYVLGGTARPGPARTLRRITRALRGRSGPSGLAPWTIRTTRPPAGPSWQRPEEPALARSPGGRSIHVDPDDLRGRDLIARAGEIDPVAARLWRRLAAAGPWTHIVDVGANYGEMIVDLPIDPAVRLVAVEPNPHVCWYLARTLREAGHAAEVVQQAVDDREGTIALTLDRTWSGLSAASLHPSDSSGHRLEPILVGATTLRRLLDDGGRDRDKRVLLKIDIEGRESAALRGLGDAAFAAFAAMIEIRHLPEPDLAEILNGFAVELFELASGALVPVPAATPARLSALLATGAFHRSDAVLRAPA